MKFVAVVTEHKNFPPTVVLCAAYMAETVHAAAARDCLPGDIAYVVEPDLHWSAEIRHPTTDAERDCKP